VYHGEKKKVRNYYDRFSSNYNNFYDSIQLQKFEYYHEELTQVKEWCVDLGGGTGLLSKYLNYPILTLDISYKMLRGAKKNEYTSLLIAGDIQNLPIRNKSIKTVLSFTAIQNTDSPREGFVEIERIIESDGTGIVTALRKTTTEKEFNLWLKDLTLKSEINQLDIEDLGCKFIKIV
jgi:ubiquinone/menaquinone biosynthesis C-methylase UbiE